MDRTGSGSQYRPSAATVANTLAISTGVASLTPSVNAPHPAACSGPASFLSTSVRHFRPSFSAMATALSAPTRCSSCTKYVFTDLPNPLHMVCSPVIDLLEFFGHQCVPQVAGPGAVMYLETNRSGA